MEEENNKIIKRNYRKIIIASVVTFVVVFFAALTPFLLLSDSCSSASEALDISDTEATVSYSEYTDSYTITITGTATNVSGKYISYAGLEFSVYDSNGYNLGSAYDNVSNLSSGDKWKFEAKLYYASSRPKTYKLADMTVIYNY